MRAAKRRKTAKGRVEVSETAPPPSDASRQKTAAAGHAAGKAFAVPELLEMVLIGLDLKTLLLSQCVSRCWRDSIKGSPKLRKKLFLQPATIAEAFELNMFEGDGFVKANRDGVCTLFNPAIVQVPDWYTAKFGDRYHRDWGMAGLPFTPDAAAVRERSTNSCWKMLVGIGELGRMEMHVNTYKAGVNQKYFVILVSTMNRCGRRLSDMIQYFEKRVSDKYSHNRTCSWSADDEARIFPEACTRGILIYYKDFLRQWNSGVWTDIYDRTAGMDSESDDEDSNDGESAHGSESLWRTRDDSEDLIHWRDEAETDARQLLALGVQSNDNNRRSAEEGDWSDDWDS